jgi:hypothetical protein
MKRKVIYTRATAPLRYYEMLGKVFKGQKCDAALLKEYGLSRQTSKVMTAMGIIDDKRRWLTLETPTMEMVEKIIYNNNQYHQRYLEVKNAEAISESKLIDIQLLIDSFKALPVDLKHKFVMETMKLDYL